MSKGIVKNIFNPIIKKLEAVITPMAMYKCKNNDNYIRTTAAFNFGLLCAAQAVVLGVNPEIPDNVKKFLIPSEIIEGIIKIGGFLFIAAGFSKIGKNILVGKGLFLPEGIVKAGTSIKEAEVIVKNILKNKNHIHYDKLKAFQEGMGNITNVLGSIIGLSIIVPPVRNKIATIWHDKLTQNLKIENQTNPNTSFAPMNNRFNFPPLNPNQRLDMSIFKNNFLTNRTRI